VNMNFAQAFRKRCARAGESGLEGFSCGLLVLGELRPLG